MSPYLRISRARSRSYARSSHLPSRRSRGNDTNSGAAPVLDDDPGYLSSCACVSCYYVLAHVVLFAGVVFALVVTGMAVDSPPAVANVELAPLAAKRVDEAKFAVYPLAYVATVTVVDGAAADSLAVALSCFVASGAWVAVGSVLADFRPLGRPRFLGLLFGLSAGALLPLVALPFEAPLGPSSASTSMTSMI